VKRKNKMLLFPQAVRKRMLQGQRCADRVVVGHPSDFLATVEKVKPDTIALGYDDPAQEEELKQQLRARGLRCRVVRIGRLRGYSTSVLLRRMNNENQNKKGSRVSV
jgi:FAD synthetase